MEYMNNTGVPIRVAALVFVGQNHDVGSGERIYGILLASQVIGSVVDAKERMVICLVTLDIDAVTVVVGKAVLVAIII